MSAKRTGKSLAAIAGAMAATLLALAVLDQDKAFVRDANATVSSMSWRAAGGWSVNFSPAVITGTYVPGSSWSQYFNGTPFVNDSDELDDSGVHIGTYTDTSQASGPSYFPASPSAGIYSLTISFVDDGNPPNGAGPADPEGNSNDGTMHRTIPVYLGTPVPTPCVADIQLDGPARVYVSFSPGRARGGSATFYLEDVLDGYSWDWDNADSSIGNKAVVTLSIDENNPTASKTVSVEKLCSEGGDPVSDSVTVCLYPEGPSIGCPPNSQNPVFLFSGDKSEDSVDLSLRGRGMDWQLNRTYSSNARVFSLMGNNWDFEWSRRLYMRDTDGDGAVDLVDPTPLIRDSFADANDDDGDLIPDADDPDPNDPAIPVADFNGPRTSGPVFGQLSPPGTGQTAFTDGGQKKFIQYIGLYPSPRLQNAVVLEGHFASNLFAPAKGGVLALVPRLGGMMLWQLPPSIDWEARAAATITRYDGRGGNAEFLQPYEGDGYLPPTGDFSRLYLTGGDHADPIAIRLADGCVEIYNGFHYPPQRSDGRLVSVTDAQGNAIELGVDPLGRIESFTDTLGQAIGLEYWGYDGAVAEAKRGLLKTVSDPFGRDVNYDYDSDSNLKSANVDGRETRYGYLMSGEYEDDSILWHKLSAVYLPREVAANGSSPIPYKTIEYYETGENIGKVKEEFVGEAAGAAIVAGGRETFEYSAPSGPGEEENRIVAKTVHTLLHDESTAADDEATDYYFNILGQIVKSVRKGDLATSDDDLAAEAFYDGEGRVVARTDIDALTGEAVYLADHLGISEVDFGGLGRLYQGLVYKSSIDCGCTPTGGDVHTEQTFLYEPVFSQMRQLTDERGNNTRFFFDYQEAPFATETEMNTLLDELAVRLGSGGPGANEREIVLGLLETMGLYNPGNTGGDWMGLGDLNGDGITNQTRGLMVKAVLTSATLFASGPQAAIDGDTTQTRELKYAWNSAGDLLYEIDEEGNKSEYSYFTSGAKSGLLQQALIDTATAAARNNATNPSPVNAKYEFDYDDRGNLTAQWDPRGVKSEYAYNLHDEVTTITRATDVDASYGQSPAEPASEVALEEFGFARAFGYDANGSLVSVQTEDPAQETGSGLWIDGPLVARDILGRPSSVSADQGGAPAVQSSVYRDAAGRPTLIVHGAGNGDYIEYDLFGRASKTVRGIQTLTTSQKKHILGLGSTAEGQLDDLGGTPETRAYTYNEKGQLWKIDDDANAGNGVDLTLEYDEFGRLAERTDRAGGYRLFEYDANSQLVDAKTYAKATTASSTAELMGHVNYVYDNIGRLVQVNRKVFVPTGVATRRTIALNAGALGGKPAGTWVGSRIEYDRLSRPAFRIDDDGNAVRIDYDGAGRTLKIVDPLGNLLEGWYDDADNLIETKRTDVATTTGTASEIFRETSFYDSLGRLAVSVDNAARASDFRWNSRDLLAAIADANGPNATARTFHRRGDGTSSVSVNNFGNVAAIDWDELGRRTKTTRWLTTSGAGDGANIARTTGGDAATAPSVDASQGGGDGKIETLYAYDAGGMLASLTDDNGNKTTWTYDAQGRAVSETKGTRVAPSVADRDDADTALTWTYDARGRVAAMEREDGTDLAYTYDALDRLTQIDASGLGAGIVGSAQQAFEYDGLSRMVKAVDANFSGSSDDATAVRAYDSLGRTVEESLRVGAGPLRTVSSDWRSGRRSSLVYGNGRRVDLGYNAAGGLASVADNGAAGPLATYDYIGSRVLRRGLKNGVSLDLRDGSGTHYDAAGRPEEWSHKLGGATQVGFGLSYDRAGNPTAVALAHDATHGSLEDIDYDSAGRLVYAEKETAWSAAGQAEAERWELDGAGNWKSKAAGPDDLTVRTTDDEAGSTPDAANKWALLGWTPAGSVLDYADDAQRGRAVRIQYAGAGFNYSKAIVGDHQSSNWNANAAKWDDGRKTVSFWLRNLGGASAGAFSINIYGRGKNASNVAANLDFYAWGASGSPYLSAGVMYVPLGTAATDGTWRLVELDLAALAGTLLPGWTLEKIDGIVVYGNHLLIDDLALIPAGASLDARPTTSFNEDISAAGNSLAHDANGNLTSDGTYTYEWDAFGRLVRVKQGATTVATYLYDASARRVRKTVGSAATTYAYNGWRTIEEYAGANESPTRQFVFGRFLDEPLAMDVNDAYGTSAIGAGDHRYYYHQNWQYSVAALSNASGALVEGYEYDPYGRHVRFHRGGSAIDFTASDTITGASASSYGNPFTYTGQRFDSETGNHYYKYRTYNSSHGRFLSRDPIGVWGDAGNRGNGYAYVSNGPVRRSDPLGLGPFAYAVFGEWDPSQEQLDAAAARARSILDSPDSSGADRMWANMVLNYLGYAGIDAMDNAFEWPMEAVTVDAASAVISQAKYGMTTSPIQQIKDFGAAAGTTAYNIAHPGYAFGDWYGRQTPESMSKAMTMAGVGVAFAAPPGASL